MVEIPNELINNVGFAILAVFSLYMMFAIGETLRRTDRRSPMRVVGYTIGIVLTDVRVIVGGLIAVFIAMAGWVFNFGDLGAAVAGLGGWMAPVWFWFTSLTMSGLNVIGVTDYGIAQVLAAAAIFAVGAGLIRVYRTRS